MAGVIQNWKTSPPFPAHLNLSKLLKEKKGKKSLMILPQNFEILIPNSRILVSPRSGDTLISKNRLMALHESFY
jgi:hypothetical protein